MISGARLVMIIDNRVGNGIPSEIHSKRPKVDGIADFLEFPTVGVLVDVGVVLLRGDLDPFAQGKRFLVNLQAPGTDIELEIRIVGVVFIQVERGCDIHLDIRGQHDLVDIHLAKIGSFLETVVILLDIRIEVQIRHLTQQVLVIETNASLQAVVRIILRIGEWKFRATIDDSELHLIELHRGRLVRIGIRILDRPEDT